MSKRLNLRYKIALKLFICQLTIYISIQLKILVANNKSEKYTDFIAFRSLEKVYKWESIVIKNLQIYSCPFLSKVIKTTKYFDF